jgi:2-amino-4-hydroxy-6-hydroxymethyldihydropteridine diphosphokinase
VEDQDWYVNGVISISTALPAQELLKSLLGIEAAMGRKRKEKWGPRVIDLDILLYGQSIIEEKNLTVPHPLMHLRRFVLVPLVELAPNLIHPVLEEPMVDLLQQIPESDQAVTPLGKT